MVQLGYWQCKVQGYMSGLEWSTGLCGDAFVFRVIFRLIVLFYYCYVTSIRERALAQVSICINRRRFCLDLVVSSTIK
jgi:hypothetical protein